MNIEVFYDEIDKALNADLMQVHTPPQGDAAFRSFAEIMAAANAVLPMSAKLVVVIYPSDVEASYVFGYLTPCTRCEAN